jgi:hypothetical protein
MRRFTRLTNAFSKKLENHCYAIALHFVYYNWCKIHKSLSVTPAMQEGLTKKVVTLEELVMLSDIEAPKREGLTKRRLRNKLGAFGDGSEIIQHKSGTLAAFMFLFNL